MTPRRSNRPVRAAPAAPPAAGSRIDSRDGFAALVDSIQGIVWEALETPDGFVPTFVSTHAERVLGYPVDDWLRLPGFWEDHVHPDDRERVLAEGREPGAVGRSYELDYRMVAADGRHVWFRDTVTPVAGEDGRPRLRGVMLDITRRRQAEQELRDAIERLEREARVDSLTGLGNRRAFEAELEAELARVERHGQALSVLVADLDDLKLVNDRDGHAAGDAYLRAFADALRASLRRHDRVYRLGGDEFAAVLAHAPGAAAPDPAAVVNAAVERVRAAGFGRAAASAGAASYPAEARTAGDLLRVSDERMYDQKRGRRGAAGSAASARRAVPDEGAAIWPALRATLAILAHDDELGDDAWRGLLEAAIAAIPGATAGSITVRDGESFVMRAVVGFLDDRLLGMRLSTAAQLAWYGRGHEAWAAGRPRVARGHEVAELSRGSTGSEQRARNAFENTGRIADIRASLVIPIVVDETVVAHLALDSLASDDAFGSHAVSVAGEFAVQATALLAARARREREAARRRELETLAALGAAVGQAVGPEQVERVLAREAMALLESDDSVFMRYDPAADTLTAVSSRGEHFPPEGTVRARAQGISWAALEAGRVVRVDDASSDQRVLTRAGPGGMGILAAPVLATDGSPIGVIGVGRSSARPFTDLDLGLIGSMAALGATAIERVRATDALEARERRFRALVDLSASLEGAHSPDEVARRTLAALAAAAEVHVIALWSLGGDRWRPTAFYGPIPEDLRATMTRGLGPGEGRIWETLSGQPVYLERTGVQAFRSSGFQGVALLPLPAAANGTRTVLAAHRGEARAWTDDERSLLEAAARSVGLALERAAYVEQIEATREGALLALGLALEARDFETRGHTERVVAASARLGQALGLDASSLEALRQGAYLHDIGKLGVPDAVLLKPGKLDPTEWEVMISHSSIGYELASDIPTLPREALEVVLHHHERWDGHGYPDGLAGEAIPLLARAFSVVDVFDALTSERPYKRAWPRDEALAEIRAQAGRQFDPAVVAAFLETEGREVQPATGN